MNLRTRYLATFSGDQHAEVGIEDGRHERNSFAAVLRGLNVTVVRARTETQGREPLSRSWSIRLIASATMGWSDEFRYRDCPWCGTTQVAMTPLGYQSVPTSGGPLRFWMPLACPRCGGLVGIETSPDGQAAEIVSIVPIGPGVENEVRHLPDDVGAYYRDAIRVMQVGVPDAAAVQLRRTLEAAAAYFEDREGNRITGGTLNQQIERLLGAGLITGPIHGAVHHVRMLGNIGAHATDERLDDERVRRALMFTTQLLRNLFEIPGELKAIQGASEDTPK